MPAIAATPVGKKTIENVLRMLQVLKMSTWLSVTHLPNETQSLPNAGTEIHQPVTENQVVKMSTSFSVTLQGLLKIRCRHPALDFTVTESVGHFGQLKKPDELVGRDSQIFDRQLAKINGPKWPVEGSQGGTPCPVI